MKTYNQDDFLTEEDMWQPVVTMDQLAWWIAEAIACGALLWWPVGG